jgi:hypothetical protein
LWIVLFTAAVERERRTPIEAKAGVLTVFITFDGFLPPRNALEFQVRYAITH